MSKNNHPHSCFILPYTETLSRRKMCILQTNPKHGLHLIGGKSEPGETLNETLLREVMEETGQELSLFELASSSSTVYTFDVGDGEATATVFFVKLSLGRVAEFIETDFQHEYPLGLYAGLQDLDVATTASTVAKLAVASLYPNISNRQTSGLPSGMASTSLHDFLQSRVERGECCNGLYEDAALFLGRRFQPTDRLSNKE